MVKKSPKSKKIKANQTEEDTNLARHRKRLQYLKARRNLRQLEINIHRMKVIAKFFAIIFVMWAIFKVACLSQWYLKPDTLTHYPNKHLKIQNNQIVSANQIINELKDIKIPHKPIYLFDTTPIEKALKTLAPVNKVYVRRFWFPARLKIDIEEKQPVLAITPSTKSKPIAVFTDDTTIFGKEFLPLPKSKKVFSVITYDDFYKWSNKHVKYIVKLTQLIEENSREKLVYLDIRNPDDVYVQLQNVRLRLGELDRLIFKRTQRIGSVMGEALKIKNNIDYIDLRWSSSISIKLKDKAQKEKELKEAKEKAKKESDIDKSEQSQATVLKKTQESQKEKLT